MAIDSANPGSTAKDLPYTFTSAGQTAADVVSIINTEFGELLEIDIIHIVSYQVPVHTVYCCLTISYLPIDIGSRRTNNHNCYDHKKNTVKPFIIFHI